jgi:hypothetical protein
MLPHHRPLSIREKITNPLVFAYLLNKNIQIYE